MCFGGGGGGAKAGQAGGQTAGLSPNIPISVDPVVQQARSNSQRKNRAAAGSKATILTRTMAMASPRASLSTPGMGAPAQNKVLLGQ